VKIVHGRISIAKMLAAVADESAGGTVIFVGTVRDRSHGMRVSRLELEAAEDMARADLERIAKLASKKYDVLRISVVHRIGRLKVGDAIVLVAVSAPHRSDAFAACRFLIDQLKKSTPIWKKEIGPGSERWVEQEA